MIKQYSSLGDFLDGGAPLPSPDPVELARHEDDGGRTVPAPIASRPYDHLIGRSRKRARKRWEASQSYGEQTRRGELSDDLGESPDY